MNPKNIWIILRREFLSRVKRKWFLIMTILTPLLMLSIIFLPVYLQKNYSEQIKNIVILDSTGNQIDTIFKNAKYLHPISINADFDSLKILLKNKQIDAILVVKDLENKFAILYTIKPLGELQMNEIKSRLTYVANKRITSQYTIPPTAKVLLDKPFLIKNKLLRQKSEITVAAATSIGVILGVLLYFFIFMYSSQIMHSAKEEKRSRIVEIIISSAKPTELLTGKILGITLVALLQFLIWIILGFLGILILNKFYATTNLFGVDWNFFKQILNQINLGFYIFVFLIYFIFGYLIYGLMFAVVGASVDNDSDMQQFMLPITIPLILPMILMSSFIQSPDSQLSFWFSIIPFTSPITMPIVIGAGYPDLVSIWQLILSIVLLILTFVLIAYLAGKIYRIGILTYGKKITYKDFWKWIKAK